MAQMEEQIKFLEKELSDEEIANLPGAEFKTLVIRMLTEMMEYRCKIEEKVNAMESEINKNLQGTSCEGKEVRIRISNLQLKEEINIQSEQQEETRIQKQNEESVRNVWDISKCTII